MWQRILIISSFLLLSVCGKAQLQQYAIEQLDSLQLLEPRPVLVFMYTDWCVYCKQMRYTTFRNKQLIEILNKKFYVIAFNGEQQSTISFKSRKFEFVPTGDGTGYHQLLFALGMPKQEIGYPSISFLRNDLTVIDNASGYLSAKELIFAAKKVLEK